MIFADEDEAAELAEKIRSYDNWTNCENEIKRLCEIAGLKDEFENADGDTFESIINEAADFFNVEIY